VPPPLGPDPDVLHPVPEHPRIMLARNIGGLGNVEIGAYTYCDEPGGPDAFRANILYHFGISGDRLRIGRFCAIATGVRFMMNDANHRLDGLTTFPFQALSADWRGRFEGEASWPSRGDTVIGNDVWLGYEALVLPGATIGDGAVVGARAVVGGDVPPYAVAVGNPARIVRRRFDDPTVARLLALRWWDWDIEAITRNLEPLCTGRLDLIRPPG
jgi:virginiamycin A acetyltransferase